MNKKKIIFIAIGVIVCVLVIVCFILALMKHNNTSNISGDNASSISSKYDGINYGDTVSFSGEAITKGGSYEITGEVDGFVIDTDDDVQLVLNNATITNKNGPAIYAEDANSVSIVLKGENIVTSNTTEELDGAIYSTDDLIFSGDGSLSVISNLDGIVSKVSLIINSGTYTIDADDDGIRGKDSVAIVDGVFNITAGGDGIKSTNEEDSTLGTVAIDGGSFTINSVSDAFQAQTNLTINGGTYNITTTGNTNSVSAKGIKGVNSVVITGGTIEMTTTDDGVHSDGDISISGGVLTINSKDDGIHADGMITIDGGTFNITCSEGIEATYVKINDGVITISASDDGINAGNKSNKYSVTIEINGGSLTITMGQGDTDGIDSNGNLYINGGTVNITCNSPFDYDGEAKLNGGTLIVNGSQTTSITNQMMGGPGGMQGNNRGGYGRGGR